MRSEDTCTKGIELEQRIITLEAALQEIKEDVSDIRHSLAHRLPLWATALITILSSISVGLLVKAFF